MGQTARMERDAKWKKEQQLKRERVPAIEVLEEDVKIAAGLDVKTVRDFSTGTSGLKTVKKKKRGDNWWDM